MGDGMLALTWNNHSTTFFKTLSTVRLKERYTDVTLSCEGRFYQLHKLVLSTCSDYFEKIFEQTPCKHPVIVLRDVSCDELEALLNYMYLGSVSVAQNDLSRLIKVAELFQIKGLAVPDEPPKTVENNSYSSRKSDSRDRGNSYRSSQSEPSRTRPCASESSDTPVPKRARTSESYSSSEHVSQTASSVSRSNELSRLEERSRSQGNVGDSGGREGTSPGAQAEPFEFKIKQEIIHDVRDSDSEDPNSSGAFDAGNDPDDSGSFDPVHDESQSNLIVLPKSEPEDIPPDESSVTEPGLDQDSYGEDVLGVAGPSDAQGWYSEGDASGGLPGDKGSIGDESQDMRSLFSSQQQSQQPMVLPLTVSSKGSWRDGKVKIFRCHICHYSTKNRTHLQHHILIHTGEKPYVCSYCSASFTFKGSMKRHERTHTGEKPFSCTECPYTANQRSCLVNHMQKHLQQRS